jgi:hypothetical protein
MSLDTDECYDQVQRCRGSLFSRLASRMLNRFQDKLKESFARMVEGGYHTAVCKSVSFLCFLLYGHPRGLIDPVSHAE